MPHREPFTPTEKLAIVVIIGCVIILCALDHYNSKRVAPGVGARLWEAAHARAGR